MNIKHTVRLILGIAVGAALVAGAKIQLAGSPGPAASDAPGRVVAGGAEYTVALPDGWTKQGSTNDGIGRTDTYRDDNGNYFKVVVFGAGEAFGSGYAADTTWRLALVNNGFTVAAKDPTCTPSELTPDCTAGNGKLEIYAMANGGAVRGHVFQFDVGNDRAETGVDTAIFEEILESFRIK